MKRLAFMIALGALVTSCQTVESVSTSQFPAEKMRKKEIAAESSSPVILFIPFGTSYIDSAREDLLTQCASPSKIEGTVSKHTSTNYFFGLFMSQKVSLSGYCVASNEGEGSLKMKARSKSKPNDEEAAGTDESPKPKKKKTRIKK